MGLPGKELSSSLVDYLAEISRENERFLKDKAEYTYKEVAELVNDAIDYVVSSLTKQGEKYVIDPLRFFLYHILMPQSYAILADLLMGNLPACFMELRLMLEALGKFYLAKDLDVEAFFEGKIEQLFEDKSITKVLKEFGEEIGLGEDPAKLWRRLSNEWVHTKGIVDRIINEIIQKGNIPPWALAIPISYGKEDLDALNELGEVVAKFREILKRTMEK